MDSSSVQLHHQEMGSQTLESMLQVCPKPQQEKKPRPADEQALKCPRCDSTNTKFCYYNNYSLSQPRYFCKSCRRYWTKGGTLRNVPVGGGCRRNKRSSSSSSSSATSSSSSSSKRNPDQSIVAIPTSIPYDSSSDLSLAIARLQKQAAASGQLGFDEREFPIWGNPTQIPGDVLANLGNSGMFDTIRNGFLETPTNAFQTMYYGGIESAGMGQEIGGIPYEGLVNCGANNNASTTGMKQENICNGGGESRGIWGFIGGETTAAAGNVAEFDQGRIGWNGIGSSSANWHGLFNSPLMSNIN